MNNEKDTYYGYELSLHKAQLLVGEPKALAYEWIVQYAKSLSRFNTSGVEIDEEDDYGYYGSVTANELIDTAMQNIQNEGRGESIAKGGLFEGIGVDPVFWDKLAIFTGTEIPHNKRENFFSCYC